VLWLKPWESRSLPGLPRTKQFLFTCHDQTKRRSSFRKSGVFVFQRRSLLAVFPPQLADKYRVHWRFISRAVLDLQRKSSPSHHPRSLPCVSSFVTSPPQ